MPRCCNGLVGENAARPFRTPAAIFERPRVRQLLGALGPRARVVEVGAGCLRNARFLQAQGIRVTVVELPGIRARFPDAYGAFEEAGGRFVDGSARNLGDWRGPFHVAVATFVIETVCCPKRRFEMLRRCRSELRLGGSLVIAVRGVADVVTAHASGIRCSDGYVTPQKTFIRSYTRRQLDALLKRAKFSHVEFLHDIRTRAPEYLYAVASR